MLWRMFTCLLLLTGASLTAMTQLPFALPKASPPDGATLFAGQCGTCHTVEHSAPPRQGPNLAGVYLRKAGAVLGYRYSPGFAQAGFVGHDAPLDAWLTGPQKLIPGAVMLYRQDDPAIRRNIIAWLKEQH